MEQRADGAGAAALGLARRPGAGGGRDLHLLIPLGVFSLGPSYLLYFLGLQRIPAQVASVVALLEPVSGVLFGLFLFDEIPNLLGVIGGVLIPVSITLISRPRSRSTGRPRRTAHTLPLRVQRNRRRQWRPPPARGAARACEQQHRREHQPAGASAARIDHACR